MPRTEDQPREAALASDAGLSRSAAATSAAPCAAVRARSAERRPQRHVRHQRQRVVESSTPAWPGESSRRRSALPVLSDAPRKSIASARSSALRVPAPSSSIAAVKFASPYLPAGSAAAPALTISDDVGHRHFVHFDNPHRQAVGERALLNRRQLQRRHRSGRRRLGSIGRLLRGARAVAANKRQPPGRRRNFELRNLELHLSTLLRQRPTTRSACPARSHRLTAA